MCPAPPLPQPLPPSRRPRRTSPPPAFRSLTLVLFTAQTIAGGFFFSFFLFFSFWRPVRGGWKWEGGGGEPSPPRRHSLPVSRENSIVLSAPVGPQPRRKRRYQSAQFTPEGAEGWWWGWRWRGVFLIHLVPGGKMRTGATDACGTHSHCQRSVTRGRSWDGGGGGQSSCYDSPAGVPDLPFRHGSGRVPQLPS